MKLKDYLTTWDGLNKENKFSRLIIGGLLASVILMSLKIVSQDQVVVFEPPLPIDKKTSVTKNAADETYKEAWAMALAEIIGNANPSQEDFIKNQIAVLLHPSIYHDVINIMSDEAERMKLDKVSYTFLPKVVATDKSLDKIFVFGDSQERGSDGRAIISGKRTYEFRIEINNYKPLITHINTYEGEPKSEQVIMKIENRLERQNEREKKNAN